MVLHFTEVELRKLTKLIGSEWRELGTHLKIQYARIQHFSMNNAGDVGNAIFCMLNEWQQGRLADTSCSNIMNELADALEQTERGDLAGDIRSRKGFHGTTDLIPPDPLARGGGRRSRMDEPDRGPVDSQSLNKRKRQSREADEHDETARKKLRTSVPSISDNEIQDIVETFNLNHLEDVYTRLGLLENDIVCVRQQPALTPKQQAKRILFLWRNRRGTAATKGAVIKAVKECQDCKASLEELMTKWRGKGPKHVMISYKSESRVRMLKLRDELKDAGFKLWMDVDNMEGNMDDHMAAGVEQAYAVLVCFSKLYQESDFCKREAQYAKDQNKLIIPLQYEDYKPDGWLGIMINPLMYYDVQTKRRMMKELPKIIKVLGVQHAKTLEQDEADTLSTETIPIQATDDTTSADTSMARSSPDVTEIQDDTHDTGTDEPDTGIITFFTEDDFDAPLISKVNLIGSGGFAKVYKLTMKNGSAEVAGKKLYNFQEKNRRELAILAKLDHRNVVKMYGCIDDKDKDWFIIVMEKADMSLKEYLEKHGNFQQNKPCNPVLLKKWMHQVCDAIQYLHGRTPLPVVHRDIRGANCLLFGNEYLLKLADFGLSRETDHTTETTAGIGTAGYKAPELCPPYLSSADRKPCFSVKSDIYALGMLFYEMYTGQVPQLRHDHEGRAVYNQPIKDPIFHNIRDLLDVCWQKDYKDRPIIEEVQGRLP